MKIEEAIVYVMVKRNGGMTTDQIADAGKSSVSCPLKPSDSAPLC